MNPAKPLPNIAPAAAPAQTEAHQPAHHDEFHAALTDAMGRDAKVQQYVHRYEPHEYAEMKTYLHPDKKSGFAVKPDGDIVSVFSTERGRGDTIMNHAKKVGGKKLDAFDGYLPTFYTKHGFKEYRREKNWTAGGPDVVYMRLHPFAQKGPLLGKFEEKYQRPLLKKEGDGVHQEYRDNAHKQCDVLFRVKVKGCHKLTEDIPLHMSLKCFNSKDEFTLDEVKRHVKDLDIQKPDLKGAQLKPIIFTNEKTGRTYYMLKLDGLHPKYEEFNKRFHGRGITHKNFMSHITIDKPLYEQIKREGIKAEDLEFGPLLVEHGAGNPVHNFQKSEDLYKAENNPIVYHGTNSTFDQFDVSHQKSGFYPGIYSTSDKERAQTHGKNVYAARLKGKYFEFTDPNHADRVAQELGVRHTGSGHPLASKLQELGYSGIKRGTEYITFHHSNIEKLADHHESLEKGPIKNTLAALGAVSAMATATGMPTSNQAQASMKPAPKAQVARKPAAIPQPQSDYTSRRMLDTIAQVESSGGKNVDHEELTSRLHSGESAFGKYGLTPLVIRETVKMNRDLKGNHKKLLALKGDDLHRYMQDNPGLEDEIAHRHLKRLEHHFGEDPGAIGYAWLNGVTGTYRAKKGNKDIDNHWHVKKIKDAYSKTKGKELYANYP